MNPKLLTTLLFLGGALVPAGLQLSWLSSAEKELAAHQDEVSEVAIASAADDEYCSPHLKKVLRRVAGACGLLKEGGRGCQPGDAKSVAALDGNDFNTLFVPLSHRAGLVQFDADQVELDDGGKALVEKSWSEQRGASFFFVVSRASPDGNAEHNRELSQKRAEAVLAHLEARFKDPDIPGQVGLLFLGEEYAQLDERFCSWTRSRDTECTEKEINRSAFVAWIDCPI